MYWNDGDTVLWMVVPFYIRLDPVKLAACMAPDGAACIIDHACMLQSFDSPNDNDACTGEGINHLLSTTQFTNFYICLLNIYESLLVLFYDADVLPASKKKQF